MYVVVVKCPYPVLSLPSWKACPLSKGVSTCFHRNDAQPHIIEVPGLLLIVPVAYTTLPAPRDNLINQLLLILRIYAFQELFTEEADPF